METYDTPKYYILQQYYSDKTENIRKKDSNCINMFYYEENGKDKT